ncbi:50S ribosomal protein L13, partial [bacterium J17]
SNIAAVLRGKNKPTFTPHNDGGDFVVVVNAEKVKLTGRKFETKLYQHHTGYIGGLKEETASELLARKPDQLVKKAVKGMLPKTTLGRAQLAKLRVYAGTEHPHSAQQPVELKLG